ncbi:GerAB/ArcD/ProY family transporter, partial [Fictibacillus sp. NRS-1165]|uniref:GerAB/ArcD/ProY family transporter n=1 Tax=Fictibacillus sp. NRS-1165 TaxID=3144463 RepID=UPI003D21E1D0
IRPVVKTALTQTLFIPFGESVVFAMIFPYLNNPKKLKWTGLCALGLSGFNLAIAMAINISVLGVDLATRSQFPLLSTVQSISIAEFLERLDVFFMLALIINGFFKIGLFFYVTVTATASLFKIKKPSSLAYPLGIVTLLLSNTIASNFSEHLQEGLRQVPFILHLPFQVIIPLLLLIVVFFKNRKKSSKQKNDIHR